MPTRSEWEAGETRAGRKLPVARVNRFRASRGLPPLPANVELPRLAHNKIRGLGDVVDAVTTATGIKSIVNAVTGGCVGCQRRREKLNKLVPFE